MDTGTEELLSGVTAEKLPAGSTHSTADMISTDGEFEERFPLDDDDIEKAAEQVVDEWTNRLQGVEDALYDEAQEKEGEVGTMNPDLPAGGYEEVVMGFDTENGEVIEEEIVDESYSEEEIVEDTTDDDENIIVDDVVREAIGEAAGDSNTITLGSDALASQAPDNSPTMSHGSQDGSGQVHFADDFAPVEASEDDNYDYVEQTIRDEDFVEGVDGQIYEAEPSNVAAQEEEVQEQATSLAAEDVTANVTPEEVSPAFQHQDDDFAVGHNSELNEAANSSVMVNGDQQEKEVEDNEYDERLSATKSDPIEIEDPPEEQICPADSHEPLISSYGSIVVNQEDLAQTYEAYEEPEGGHETFGNPNATTKPETFQSQQATEPKAKLHGNTGIPNIMMNLDGEMGAGSDIESGMSTTPVPEKKRKYDDDDDSDSDDDDDDDGFLFCVILLAFVCLIPIILAIVLPIVLTRRNRAQPATLVPTVRSWNSNYTTFLTCNVSPFQVAPATGSPTMSPTNIVFDWVSSVDNVHGPELSQFGAAIALDDNFYIAGAPNDNNTGAVYTALFDGENWNLIPPLYGESDGDKFGAAVDTTDGYMIVGSPSRKANGTLTEVGQAYLYLFQSSTDVWLQVGPTLQGDEDMFAAGGEFGKSVSVGSSLLPRVVVGAPRHSKSVDSLENGRVYTFESNAKSWQSLDFIPILGKNANDWFGSAVDMTDKAERFIVGAPGANGDASGYIQVYEWQSGEWAVDFEASGESRDNFGASVLSIPGTDDTFVVGAPGHRNGRGRIVVYRRLSPSTYIQLGPDIVGDVNENLGRTGSINGAMEDDTLLLVFASLDGTVKTYRFDSSSATWLQQGLPLETGHSAINIDYSEEDGLLVSDVDADKALLYEPSLVSVTSIHSYGGQPNIPTTTPTQAPVPQEAPVGGFGVVQDGI